MTEITIELARGQCPVRLVGDAPQPATPTVLLFMDAFGPRPTLHRLADGLAGEGYRVLLPDLFYAHRPYEPLRPESVLSGGEDRNRLGVMLGALTQEAVNDDVRGLIDAVTARWPDAPVAAVGYCMGGRFALTAGAVSPAVVAAASFHGATLAPAEGEGPHRQLAGSRAAIYVGVAAIDPMFDAEEAGRLACSLRAGGVDHVIETYPGAAHGFVMEDLPVHNPVAAARHWLRLTALLSEAFAKTVTVR